VGQSGVNELRGGWKPFAVLLGIAILGTTVLVGAVLYRYGGLPNTLPNGFDSFLVDPDHDGRANYLVVKTRASLPSTDQYRVTADLVSGSQSVSSTSGVLELSKGSNLVSVAFRGGDIEEARASGALTANIAFTRVSGAAPYTTVNVHTLPAVSPTSFKSRDSAVVMRGEPITTLSDTDGDQRIDAVTVRTTVEVSRAAYYQFKAEVVGGVRQVGTQNARPHGFAPTYDPRSLGVGVHTIETIVPGGTLYASGIRGGIPVYLEAFTTPSGHYCYGDEGASSLPAENGDAMGLVSPYVMPSRPLDLGDSTTITIAQDFDHFEAPTMPADFQGTVRDEAVADGLRITADLVVNQAGQYDLSGMLYARGSMDATMAQGTRSTIYQGGTLISTAWTRIDLSSSTTASLTFPAGEIAASGLSGPYDVKLRLVPASLRVIDPVIVHVTSAYDVNVFTAGGDKPARIASLAADLVTGQISVGLSQETTLLVRVIHENGIIVYESADARGAWAAFTSAYNFRSDVRGEYAVAAYLFSNGRPADYREIIVTA